MCGRTSLFVPLGELEDTLSAEYVADGGYTPRYNIAPGDALEDIRHDAPEEIDRCRWGLIPFWADDPTEGIINARTETVAEKRVFERAWTSRPCIVPSSGFYEWQSHDGGPKQPYRIYRADAPVFAMAGLWDVWEGDEETIACVTILTTEANELLAPIHDRMPVILPREAERTWLQADPEERRALCRPYPDNDLTADPIPTAVNNPANDRPRIIEPLGHEQSGLDAF